VKQTIASRRTLEELPQRGTNMDALLIVGVSLGVVLVVLAAVFAGLGI
jgi:hypothetical protein